MTGLIIFLVCVVVAEALAFFYCLNLVQREHHKEITQLCNARMHDARLTPIEAFGAPSPEMVPVEVEQESPAEEVQTLVGSLEQWSKKIEEENSNRTQ